MGLSRVVWERGDGVMGGFRVGVVGLGTEERSGVPPV